MSNKVHERGMEMEEEGSKKATRKIQELPKKILKDIWKVGKDDPRRVKHALKVGVSLTLVSLLYLLEPLFKGIGSNAMWAVLTVVVVLEFSAGAAITYLRFIPYIKKNYDYGMLIFLLTFNLITVSSYRVDAVIKIAHERFYTIAIGVGVCLCMTLLFFPIWSGEDLHKSTVAKLQGLSFSIEACVKEYFGEEEKDKETSDSSEDMIYDGYKTVLDSKSTDEALAMYASWEPRHTRHCHRFPWQHYVKVGAVLRQFGYTVVALHGCLKTEIQTPSSIRVLFKDPCVRLAGEICKVLTELAASIQNRRRCSPEILSESLQVALQDLNSAIKSQPKLFFGSDDNVSQNGNSGRHNQNVPVTQHINKDANDDISHQNETGSPLGQNTGTPRGGNKSRFGPNDGASSFSRLRADTLERRSTAATGERRILMKQLSRIVVMTSLEFSEALPFAAFASLLVEMVARLDNVIEEVEELGTVACFKEYDGNVVDRTDVEVVENPADLVVGVE
ncbi:PREDICTED: aluminum-activated malate transporter 14-like isoform X3 [Brassica oleracea var. oleracea]|uniref:aluminum-activated malate transporter 14-like isoform X3 n=1 Tax=Brassica oleracea var. oleracea TaxID=109376 RepID=UPI0006A752A7|nr:PREDICTED: aluminum-activated malate transporter 14-like isoform X3 [Brassica oleracea var. oleracea]